ncbi:MAG: bifunctional hydroxymethylpyrimidine kinase/phosphomethylpyrimidine kinase [Lentisphaeria bacterium]|nr:bifunctional hydroxymethylpyrimidine kinase/phosphomethylpyrimidine kinase [Lentisphaeria bacterium]
MKKVLTIAGSDCSGGAGIQADLKTMAAHHVYGMSVITALTAQNTLGVQAIHEAPPAFVGQQLDCVFTDIVPDAVKVGMVSSAELIHVIAEKLRFYQVKNLVVDPVMVATSGSRLLADAAVDALRNELLPLATVITPNLPETEALAEMAIRSQEGMLDAAKLLAEKIPGAILVKGGHFGDNADDLLYAGHEAIWFRGERIDNPNTHGTGCTLSSAIASQLALGCSLPEAVRNAKDYLTGALRHDPALGHGHGPLDHLWKLPR